MSLKSRIQKILEADKIRPAQLSRDAGVSRSAVSQWLSGNSQNIDYQYAAKIEKKRGWRKEWLMTGELPERVNGPEPEILSKLTKDEQRQWLLLLGQITTTQRSELKAQVDALIQKNSEVVRELGADVVRDIESKIEATIPLPPGNAPGSGPVRYEGRIKSAGKKREASSRSRSARRRV